MIGSMASVAAAPSFARADADAPWRPSPDRIAEARITALVGRAGARSLEDLQAQAAADPGWFWGEAVDDLGLDWQRAFRSVVDTSRGIAFPTWWIGGAFNHAVASTERW